MVIQAVMSDGRRRPNWGKPESRPCWWPGDVEFTDVNNSKDRPRLEQLLAILDNFKEWNKADTSVQGDQEMSDDDEGPQSPEVPPYTGTTTTPAQTTASPGCAQTTPSSVQFTCTSAPTSSSPVQFISACTPLQFTSTPVPSVPSSSVSQPPVSPIPTGIATGMLDLIRRNFGARSNYLSDSRWRDVFNASSQLSSTQSGKLLCILGKLNEDGECDIIINADAARDILGCMVKLPWDVNRSLCQHILRHFPVLQLPKFLTSEDQRRLPERFLSYVPPYITDLGLEPFYGSGDGNCFYNSISVIMTGTEETSAIFRLGAALYGLAHYEHIVQANAMCFSDKDDALQWASCVSLSVQETADLKDATVNKIIAESVKLQVVSALTNFTDVGLLQVSFMAGFLKMPIQQHCILVGAAHYNTTEKPPCCVEEGTAEKPFQIIWLPLTGQGNTFNHISPLLPWKCGVMDSSHCIFWRGLNSEYKSCNEMVQCLTCNEWYHCACLGITLDEAKDSTIMDCGCSLPRPYRSRDRSLYSSQASVLNFLTTSYLKSLTRKLLIEKSEVSLRLALHISSHFLSQRRLLVLLGTGPLHGRTVDLLVERLKAVASPIVADLVSHDNVSLRSRLVMDVLLPESIIRLIMHLEDINYFRACQFFQTSRAS